MLFIPFAFLFAFCTSAVKAHFRLQFPEPRGAFVAQKEIDFCGGYTDAVNNRTSFPLSGGIITINSGHENFVIGVLLSTSQNPNTWEAFNNASGEQQLVRNYARQPSAGTFCIPVDLNSTGIAGVQEGTNVTIQIVYSGGDGNLYQCADVMLASNATSRSCTNQTQSSHVENGSSSSNARIAAAALSFSFSLFVVFVTVFL